jgi:hypothetical protein
MVLSCKALLGCQLRKTLDIAPGSARELAHADRLPEAGTCFELLRLERGMNFEALLRRREWMVVPKGLWKLAGGAARHERNHRIPF